MTVPPMSPGAYAEAVRAALADLPAADREELLEDLDDHLAEVAAEPGMTLEDRLGPPEEYAAELRAAYGGRPAARPRLRLTDRARTRVTGLVRSAHTRSLRFLPYRQAVAFAPELRPAWWVLRGYVIALFLLAVNGQGRLIPGDLAAWAFTLAAVWVSVWVGRRSGMRTWGRGLLVAVNAVAAIVLLGALASPPVEADRGPVMFADGPQPYPYGVRVENVSTLDGGNVYNIIPYDKDGSPLHDVRLYDQDGNPIIVDPEMFGQAIAVPCDGEPPLRNAYPLPLTSGDVREHDGSVPCVMRSPSPESPSPSASPTSSAEPSRTPGPSPKPSPSPSGAQPDGK
ncbi:hypothetical protein Pth03_13200 [Planotetraspora thailandica]|uniref:Uncharacterized protein n=1 Tax=Planotetraspora thailandica TaxID=487172 RepID=A0A8J3UXY6_9ACTN|nr:hypothetical protein [Planotetraspora thailandica]GII52931.1 hypothetical protein Pth03_13200 [Planotetraspora thailandica]